MISDRNKSLSSLEQMDIHKLLGKLPRPGPWNPLSKQLDENDLPIEGQEPVNKVDEISLRHDITPRSLQQESVRRCNAGRIE